MRAAYDALPDDLRRQVEGKVVVHSFGFSRSLIDPGIGSEIGRDYPPVRHVLVRANPRNGRKSIYVGSHAWYIEGMEIDDSRILIAKLLEITTRPERVYRHHWRVGDLVMWDNRCVLHRGRLWDSAPRAGHAPDDRRRRRAHRRAALPPRAGDRRRVAPRCLYPVTLTRARAADTMPA